MEIILHRINKVSLLKKIDRKYGMEIDVRSKNNQFILNHEPYEKGDNFIDYLDNYYHKTLVINLKESGIEKDILGIMKRYKHIKSYFLLDIEFPFIYYASINKIKNIALRFSEKEPIENSKIFINKFKWIWIDTFTKLPINKKNIITLNKFKKCLVCPSRYNRDYDIKKYKNILKKNNFHLDAVMTEKKYSEEWSNL